MNTMLLDHPRPLAPEIDDDLTRRRLLWGAGGLTAGFLAGCADDGDSRAADPTPSATAAAWSFTDDRGVTVNLPARPARIAAYEIAGAPLMFLGVPVLAVFGGTTIAESGHYTGLDLAGVDSAGQVYGEVNYDKLAALDVDLIVALFNADQPAVFGFDDAAAQAKAEAIAPIVALDGTADLEPTMARFVALAELLGADVAAPAVRAARSRYDAARDAVREAVTESPACPRSRSSPTPARGRPSSRPPTSSIRSCASSPSSGWSCPRSRTLAGRPAWRSWIGIRPICCWSTRSTIWMRSPTSRPGPPRSPPARPSATSP